MTSNDPEQIRADIERTRAALSNDVDTLTEQANPKNVAKRQVDKVKDRAGGLKDRVMGSASDSADSLSSTASHAGDSLASAPGEAKSQARSRTQGNPLAAGLIAFGAGLLISSLIPASQKEQDLAAGVKDNIEPLKQQVTEAAKDVADQLRGPAQDAAESVKATATEAVDTVKQDGSSAVTDVQDQAQQSKEHVEQTR